MVLLLLESTSLSIMKYLLILTNNLCDVPKTAVAGKGEDGVKGKAETKRLLTKMMREALRAFHRRLIAVSEEDSEKVLIFLILKITS